MLSTAEQIRPFVGGNFGITAVNNNFLRQTNITGIDLQDHSGSGYQIEIGVTNNTYSGYIGYRSGASSDDDLESHDYRYRGQYIGTNEIRGSDLTSEHFIAGARAQLKVGLPEIIRPIVGLGVSRGYVKREFKWTPYNFGDAIENGGQERSESVESDTDWGGLLEFGVALRPKIPFQIYLLYQLHAMQARYETYQVSPLADQYEIREQSFRLGIIYNFKTLGESE